MARFLLLVYELFAYTYLPCGSTYRGVSQFNGGPSDITGGCLSHIRSLSRADASAVFNTFDHFGQAIRLALVGVFSDLVTHESIYASKTPPGALLTGYLADSWTRIGWMILICFMGALGLRKSGRISRKRD